jgi:hypothetical protein
MSVDFDSAIGGIREILESESLKTELWVDQFGWKANESLASQDPFAPQMLAALQTFMWFYANGGVVGAVKRMWVHLAAEMQAGKTGVISTLIRLVLSNEKSLKVKPSRCFVITGMSDEAWESQTKERLPDCVRENVHHGATLAKMSAKLESLAEGEPDKKLRNILIIIDESHYASGKGNQTNKRVYNIVSNKCPRNEWVENNIRFMTVSATDPNKVLAMQGSELPTEVVRLYTTVGYQSVKKLLEEGRIRAIEHKSCGLLHTPTGMAALIDAVHSLENKHGPLIHILRPNHAKTGVVKALIEAQFPDSDIIEWDVKANQRRMRENASSASSVSSDINRSQLADKPPRTRFILLKGMFRAAKTLDDTHVGVMFDRVGTKDSTTLQSLLGRACGYGKSNRTIIFTSINTVNNYVKLWHELCTSKYFANLVTDFPAASLKGKMPGVTAIEDSSTKGTILLPALSTATPLGTGDALSNGADAGPRNQVNEDDYEVIWSEEVRTLEEAQRLLGAKNMKKNENGFHKNATGGKGPMSRAEFLKVKSGKKTAQSRVSLKVGQVQKRTFAAYEDTTDPTSVFFVVKTLKRLR